MREKEEREGERERGREREGETHRESERELKPELVSGAVRVLGAHVPHVSARSPQFCTRQTKPLFPGLLEPPPRPRLAVSCTKLTSNCNSPRSARPVPQQRRHLGWHLLFFSHLHATQVQLHFAITNKSNGKSAVIFAAPYRYKKTDPHLDMRSMVPRTINGRTCESPFLQIQTACDANGKVKLKWPVCRSPRLLLEVQLSQVSFGICFRVTQGSQWHQVALPTPVMVSFGWQHEAHPEQ